MNRILKLIAIAILMASASIAFGQGTSTGNTGGVGSTNGQQIGYTIDVNIANSSISVTSATINYRVCDEYLDCPNPWKTVSTDFMDPTWIHFSLWSGSCTNSNEPRIEYEIRAYNGSKLVRSHCGISPLVKYYTPITINSWNKCLGEDNYEDFPNHTPE